QDTLAWLMSVPPEMRTKRLRHLAEDLASESGAREKFQSIWAKAFAPRLFSEAGLPEATSLPRELINRIKRRLLPQLEDEVGRYAQSPDRAETCEALEQTILDCRISAGLSHARLEEQGVSSDLVFRLDLLISQLERMDVLLRVASGREDGRRFASMLVRGFA